MTAGAEHMTLTVELTVREIRALHGASSLLTDALMNAGCGELVPDDGVTPAESAVMKLETALVAAGEEL